MDYFKVFRKIPHRVKICALALGVMAFCSVQRVTFMIWVKRIINKVQDEDKSNCSFVVASWDLYYASHEATPDFFWDRTVSLSLLKSFYIGYMTSVIPAGVAVDFYGPRKILLSGFLISTIACLLFPILVNFGPFEGSAIIAFQGIGQGTLNSGTAVLIAYWAPTVERTRFVSFMESGKLLGIIFGMIFVRMLLYVPWEGVFFMVGAMSLMYYAACWVFLCSRPSSCVHVSHEEKAHIFSTRVGLVFRRNDFRYPFTPWKKMLTAPCYLSLLLYSACQDGMNFLIYSTQDFYFYDVVHLGVKLTGMVYLSSAFAVLISAWFWGVASDLLINNHYISRTANRKLSGCVAMCLTTPMLFATLLSGCDGLLAATCQIILCYSRGFPFATDHAIPIDLSPQYAGATMALVNFVGHFSGLLVREVFESLVSETSDIDLWWDMYAIMAVASVVGTLQFLVLGRAEIQAWNFEAPVYRMTFIPTPIRQRSVETQ